MRAYYFNPETLDLVGFSHVSYKQKSMSSVPGVELRVKEYLETPNAGKIASELLYKSGVYSFRISLKRLTSPYVGDAPKVESFIPPGVYVTDTINHRRYINDPALPSKVAPDARDQP